MKRAVRMFDPDGRFSLHVRGIATPILQAELGPMRYVRRRNLTATEASKTA